MTTCHPVYSGWAVPETRTMSPAATPAPAAVPVVRSVLSGLVGLRFVRIVTDPDCTVTVSLLRERRRAASATVVSVAFDDGRLWGAALRGTERGTMMAVKTVPGTSDPAVGFVVGVPAAPSGSTPCTTTGSVVPVAVTTMRMRPVSTNA